MAFDATYITASLNQAEINGKRALVGGEYDPERPQNSFVPMDEDKEIDTSSISKSSSMLEFIGWDPSQFKKTPISLMSVPVAISFQGAGSDSRGNFYMANLVGAFLEHSDGIVKAIVCDNHSTHKLIRRCMHGQLVGDEIVDVLNVKWFGALHYTDVPSHVLPRFPMRVAYQNKDAVYGLPGVCVLAILGMSSLFFDILRIFLVILGPS